MLADPRSIALAENFGGQWLGYAELDSPDQFRRQRSEEATKLMRSMYREPLLFFDDLVRSDRSLLELIDSRHTFLNPTLGYHYGLKGYKKPRLIKDGGYDWADPLERVAIDDPNRGGVLGMAATHVLTSAVERMLSYALGRSIEYSDRPTIDRLVDALKANDYRFSVLVKGIVASVPFGYRED